MLMRQVGMHDPDPLDPDEDGDIYHAEVGRPSPSPSVPHVRSIAFCLTCPCRLQSSSASRHHHARATEPHPYAYISDTSLRGVASADRRRHHRLRDDDVGEITDTGVDEPSHVHRAVREQTDATEVAGASTCSTCVRRKKGRCLWNFQCY